MLGTSITRRPCRCGTVRNGMYAGVGTMMAAPGEVNDSITNSKAAMTSGTSRTSSADTFQP
jgi:hypothetical protein